MTDYLTANRDKIKAIIGLGDLVTGSIKRVFDQVGVKPGEIPVVGWGNSLDTTQEVLDGYVNAGQWQDPQATSYIAPVARRDGDRAASRRASTSSPARSTRRTPRQLYRRHHGRQVSPPIVAAPAAHCRRGRLSFRPEQPDDRPEGRSASMPTQTRLVRRFIAKPEFGPLVLLVADARRLHRDQPGLPVAAQHLATRWPSRSNSA